MKQKDPHPVKYSQLVENNFLYKQIKSLIRQQVIDGIWKPGDKLPSEHQLGKNFGVSQGTIRKALQEMAAENIFTRQQGKGTFVSKHTTDSSLFQFFRIVRDGGKNESISSKVLFIRIAVANRTETERLLLNTDDKVLRIKRIRLLEDIPAIIEDISLPVNIFQKFVKADELPNSLYPFYESQFGVKIIKIAETIHAIIAKKEMEDLLNLPGGSPALMIDRTAIALDGRHVEWRMSYVDTRTHHYFSQL
jgi:GntR family transcriptional regulator